MFKKKGGVKKGAGGATVRRRRDDDDDDDGSGSDMDIEEESAAAGTAGAADISNSNIATSSIKPTAKKRKKPKEGISSVKGGGGAASGGGKTASMLSFEGDGEGEEKFEFKKKKKKKPPTLVLQSSSQSYGKDSDGKKKMEVKAARMAMPVLSEQPVTGATTAWANSTAGLYSTEGLQQLRQSQKYQLSTNKGDAVRGGGGGGAKGSNGVVDASLEDDEMLDPNLKKVFSGETAELLQAGNERGFSLSDMLDGEGLKVVATAEHEQAKREQEYHRQQKGLHGVAYGYGEGEAGDDDDDDDDAARRCRDDDDENNDGGDGFISLDRRRTRVRMMHSSSEAEEEAMQQEWEEEQVKRALSATNTTKGGFAAAAAMGYSMGAGMSGGGGDAGAYNAGWGWSGNQAGYGNASASGGADVGAEGRAPLASVEEVRRAIQVAADRLSETQRRWEGRLREAEGRLSDVHDSVKTAESGIETAGKMFEAFQRKRDQLSDLCGMLREKQEMIEELESAASKLMKEREDGVQRRLKRRRRVQEQAVAGLGEGVVVSLGSYEPIENGPCSQLAVSLRSSSNGASGGGGDGGGGASKRIGNKAGTKKILDEFGREVIRENGANTGTNSFGGRGGGGGVGGGGGKVSVGNWGLSGKARRLQRRKANRLARAVMSQTYYKQLESDLSDLGWGAATCDAVLQACLSDDEVDDEEELDDVTEGREGAGKGRAKVGAGGRSGAGSAGGDDEDSDDEGQAERRYQDWKSRRENLMEAADLVFMDVDEEVRSVTTIKELFEEWKRNYGQQYVQCFCSSVIPDLITPFARVELIKWQPSQGIVEVTRSASSATDDDHDDDDEANGKGAHEKELTNAISASSASRLSSGLFSHFDWYRHLLHFAQDIPTPPSAPYNSGEDPDQHLIPTIMMRTVLPTLVRCLESNYDPFSSSQTQQLVSACRQVLDHHIRSTGEASVMAIAFNLSKPLETTLTNAANNLCLPTLARYSGEGLTFIRQQVFGSIKLLTNMVTWEVLMPINKLGSIVLEGIIADRLLPCLQKMLHSSGAYVASEVLTAVEKISSALTPQLRESARTVNYPAGSRSTVADRMDSILRELERVGAGPGSAERIAKVTRQL